MWLKISVFIFLLSSFYIKPIICDTIKYDVIYCNKLESKLPYKLVEFNCTKKVSNWYANTVIKYLNKRYCCGNLENRHCCDWNEYKNENKTKYDNEHKNEYKNEYKIEKKQSIKYYNPFFGAIKIFYLMILVCIYFIAKFTRYYRRITQELPILAATLQSNSCIGNIQIGQSGTPGSTYRIFQTSSCPSQFLPQYPPQSTNQTFKTNYTLNDTFNQLPPPYSEAIKTSNNLASAPSI